MSDLENKIITTISQAENNEIATQDFDGIVAQLEKEVEAESAPLLAAGQRNHAAVLKALLNGLKSLKPIVHLEDDETFNYRENEEFDDEKFV